VSRRRGRRPNELATIANDGTTCVVNRTFRIPAANDRKRERTAMF
jgi:hypothetical protein